MEKLRHGERKAECEFCGRRHTVKDDICDVKTNDCNSGNSMDKDEGAYNITLKDLYDMLTTKRDLIFEFILTSQFDKAGLAVNLVATGGSRGKGGGLSLDSCFRAYSAEELLTGGDQWYCNKCKEHRDIHKKLELYKIPKILIL